MQGQADIPVKDFFLNRRFAIAVVVMDGGTDASPLSLLIQ